MTTQAEDLLGARVTGADGKVVGTVEQVFRDDVDGTPAWARVRAGKSGRFVPLGSSKVTADGLSVPFDSKKIMSGPEIEAGQHMSAAQAEQLSQYYGLTVPAQQRMPAQEGMQRGQAMPTDETASAGGPRQPSGQGTLTEETTSAQESTLAGPDWLVRQEEQLQIGTQLVETGRVRLHKYVDIQPIEQSVHVFHEEYDIERVPIAAGEQISSDIGESVQELILHEERAVYQKEAVPVERVRLVTKRVGEDKTVRGEIRRERIEVEPDQATGPAGKKS